MFKKSKIIACALTLSFLVSGCSSSISDSDYNELVNAWENMKPIESYHADTSIFMETKGNDTDARMKLLMDWEQILNGEETEAKADMSAAVNGVKLTDPFSMYIKDKTMYMNFLNQKVKMTLNEESIKTPVDTNALDELFTKDTMKQYLKTLEVSEVESGKCYDVEFTDDFYKEIFTVLEKALLDQGKTAIPEEQFLSIFKDFRIQFTIDQDGYFTQFSVVSKLLVEDITLDYEIKMNISEINKERQIEFPDFSDYIEENTDTIYDDVENRLNDYEL